MKKLSKILIIDDDPMTTYIQKRFLDGFQVADQIEIVNDGEEALERIKYDIQSGNDDNIPALIFVDLNMPFMDGFQFLEAYQNLEFEIKDSVVVSVLTSSFSRKDINRVKEFPVVDDYVVKPLTQEKMMELMEKHFGWQPQIG